MTQINAVKDPIINSPFEEPSSYWSYERESRSFTRKEGRRPEKSGSVRQYVERSMAGASCLRTPDGTCFVPARKRREMGLPMFKLNT